MRATGSLMLLLSLGMAPLVFALSPELAAVGIGILCLAPALSYILLGKGDLLSPDKVFLVPFFLYAVSFPMATLSTFRESGVWTGYFFCVALGLVGFIAGIGVGRVRRSPRISMRTSVDRRSGTLLAGIWVVLGITLALIFIQRMGGLGSYLSIGYGTTLLSLSTGLGFLSIGFDIINSGMGLLLYYRLIGARQKNNGVFWVFYVSFLVVVCLFYLHMGRRRHLLILATIIFGVYNYTKKVLFRRRALAFLLVTLCYLFMVLVGYGRAFLDYGLLRMPIETLKRAQLSWFNPFMHNEFVTVGSSLYYVLLAPGEPILGYSYINVLANFMPSFLYEPTMVNEIFLSRYFPSLIGTGAGRGLSILAEGYMNFRYAGVVIHLFFVGVLCALTYNTTHDLRFKPIYIVSLPWLLLMSRIDLAATMLPWVIAYIIPATTCCLVAGRRNDRRQAKEVV